MNKSLSFGELIQLIENIFVTHGLEPQAARCVAEVVAAAERDGSHSHGLARLEGYVSTLKSGWVNRSARPQVNRVAPGLVVTDADNGFAQIAVAASRQALLESVRRQGIAALAVRNSHHFGALWSDVEPYGEEGFIAIAAVNTRSYMTVWGGREKVLGTNPMAFACPRRAHPPVVWDQASSTVSHGEVLLAATAGRDVPSGAGVDAAGVPTIDPNAILRGGGLVPFGGYKGAAIAFMVEVLSAAVTGGRFGFDDRVSQFPGGKTSHAGELLIILDPLRTVGEGYFDRIEELLARLRRSGVERLPGDQRYLRRRKSAEDGISVPRERYEMMMRLGGEPLG